MKFNLKKYWREILIAILIALLMWVSSADKAVTNTGSSETVCITDTVVQRVPGAVRVGWRKIYLSHYDTIYANVVQHDTTVVARIDTSWVYTDIPVNEYRDTGYYLRTIGWLDSLEVYNTACREVKVAAAPGALDVTIYGNTMLGSGVVAPGATISVKRLQLGWNFNLINQKGTVTLGYRFR